MTAVQHVLHDPRPAAVDGIYAEIACVAALACGVPTAAVTVTDLDRVRLAGSHGLPPEPDPGAFHRMRFHAYAPILADGNRLGTVDVADQAPRELTPDQAQILQHLASVVAHLFALGPERDASLAARVAQGVRVQRPEPHPEHCELGGSGRRCERPAELKVADPWGSAAWGCADHVEEALIHARSVFIADAQQAGLDAFRDR